MEEAAALETLSLLIYLRFFPFQRKTGYTIKILKILLKAITTASTTTIAAFTITVSNVNMCYFFSLENRFSNDSIGTLVEENHVQKIYTFVSIGKRETRNGHVI